MYMNLLDFEYLKNNLDTSNLYGSDSCIANLFLLQTKYNTELKIKNGILIRYYYGDENRTGYGFPIPIKSPSKPQNWLSEAISVLIDDAHLQNRQLRFCLLTQEQKNQLDECFTQDFPQLHAEWKTNRDDCDYVYLRENLAELPGSHYQKKRNHISRFKRTYGENWEFKAFPENDIAADILKVSHKWFTEKNGESDPILQMEQESIELALQNAELLDLRGGVLYINGEPAAMTVAAPVSDDVVDVIYEKSIGEFEKNGAYAVINQQFSRRCQNFLYINREEDMGVEGLRKAKLSYKPTMILDKFYCGGISC